MNYIDTNDSVESHKARNRLYHRLKSYGYHLQSGRTLAPDGRRMVHLKRTDDIQRGFRLTDTITGEVVAGKNFDLTLEQVNQFWEHERTKRIKVKREEEAQKQREKYKLRMPSCKVDIGEDSTEDCEDDIDFCFDWEDSESFFDD